MLGFVFFLGLHVLAQAIAKLIIGRELGVQFLGEIVGRFGDTTRLDGLYVNVVCHGFARQTLVREVVAILHVERATFASFGAAQVLGEFGNGIVSPNLH